MTARRAAAACAVFLGGWFGAPLQPATAQGGAGHADAASDSAARSFVSQAIAGAQAFRDKHAAIAAGYRRLGMDFPSMGEHWVNPVRVATGRFDAARPAMLSYADVGGRPVLLGVIYAIPLGPGEVAPALPASLRARWHEHNGSVDEESAFPEHGAENEGEHGLMHSEHHSEHGTGVGSAAEGAANGAALAPPKVRLALLHVWVGVPNPRGMFAAENWAIAFVRLGIAVPAAFPDGAARALALVSGADQYYLEVARLNGLATPDHVAAAGAAIEECRVKASGIVNRPRAGRALGQSELSELDVAWRQMVRRLERTTSVALSARVGGTAGR